MLPRGSEDGAQGRVGANGASAGWLTELRVRSSRYIVRKCEYVHYKAGRLGHRGALRRCGRGGGGIGRLDLLRNKRETTDKQRNMLLFMKVPSSRIPRTFAEAHTMINDLKLARAARAPR